MVDDGFADNATESDRHGISDMDAGDGFFQGRTRFYKLIIVRKSLNQRSFPKRKSPILVGVSEPPSAVSVKLSRNGRRGLIPRHPTINIFVCLSAGFFVAVREQRFIPILPSAAGLGRLYALHIQGAKFGRNMERVLDALFSVFYGGQTGFF